MTWRRSVPIVAAGLLASLGLVVAARSSQTTAAPDAPATRTAAGSSGRGAAGRPAPVATATHGSATCPSTSPGWGRSRRSIDGGARHAEVARNEAAYDAAVATYRQTVLTAFQDVEDNASTLRILADEARQQEVAVQAAQKALDLATAQYRAGLTSYLDVITAQNALLTNQRTALTIDGQRMTASVQLIKALGGGWDRAMLPATRRLRD